MMLFRKYFVVFGFVLFVSCAKQPQQATTEHIIIAETTATGISENVVIPVEHHQSQAANALMSWEISGAMSARHKDKGWSASLNWVQQARNQYQIRLSSPLSNKTVLINKKEGLVTYKTNEEAASSTDAEKLLKQKTGIALPVNNLYYWIRAVPAQGCKYISEKDVNNHVLRLKQAGYLIEYSGYILKDGIALPSRIKLQGNGLVIKLVIKNWLNLKVS